MELSKHMAELLFDAFIAQSVPPKDPVRPKSFRWGGAWFCLRCEKQMDEAVDSNAVQCQVCGGNLGPFIYELIEFHPHRFADKWG